jgi:hypothetical protein
MSELEPNLKLEEARELRDLLVEIDALLKRLDLKGQDFELVQAHRDNLEWLANCTVTVSDDEFDQIALTRANLEWIHGYPPEGD